MKNIVKFILLSPLAFSAVGCGSKKATPVDVVVISGQSNAVGCTRYSPFKDSNYEKYYEYLEGYPAIQIAFDSWTKEVKVDGQVFFYSQNKSKDDDFVNVMAGQGNSEFTFGPEIGIAEALHEKYANKLFLIKYACGASNLKDDWAKRTSPMYNRFINYVKKQMENLKKKGYAPTIKAFCWMQGEGDSYEGYYQSYCDNLREFVTNVRTDLKELAGDKDMPFIDAGINRSVDPSTNTLMWQYYQEVNQAKQQFAAESDDNFYIDTIAEGLHTDQEPLGAPDIAHYDSESQVKLGKLFAKSFEPFLEQGEQK